MEELIMALYEEAERLETWADECRNDGWSTNLVEPMRNRALKLRSIARKYWSPIYCYSTKN